MILELAIFSQRLFGKQVKRFNNSFHSLQEVLDKAGLMLPVEAYVSMIVLVALIAFFGVALNVFVLAYVFTLNLIFSTVLSIGIGISGSMIVFALFYLYPSTVAGKKRRMIEEGLPFTLSFMSILSSAGVPPKRIFKMIALLEQEREVGLGGEGRAIYRDMEVLGEDMITALRSVARRKISPLFSGVLEGVISTVKGGGVLTGYLEEESRSLMRLRRSIMKEFIDTLVMVSEIYMALLVAFPLIMIVMLVVMSSIGGGDIGGTSPATLVPLIIYGLVPGAGVAVILMIDSMSQK
ncbi:MAG: type II secretion system F family protein [Thaumarchaeota archaeon]|nr:type II secretion system F family protein [Nitrososphaerota archaeon]MCL5316684.1 type II secretion system F family protein [Nitrososphaerota archaeon]